MLNCILRKLNRNECRFRVWFASLRVTLKIPHSPTPILESDETDLERHANREIDIRLGLIHALSIDPAPEPIAVGLERPNPAHLSRPGARAALDPFAADL